jgi:hypothetical protein
MLLAVLRKCVLIARVIFSGNTRGVDTRALPVNIRPGLDWFKRSSLLQKKFYINGRCLNVVSLYSVTVIKLCYFDSDAAPK